MDAVKAHREGTWRASFFSRTMKLCNVDYIGFRFL